MILQFPSTEERLTLKLNKEGVTDIIHEVLTYRHQESIAVHGRKDGMTISAIGDTLELALENLLGSLDVVDSLRNALIDDYTD